jgi:uncharacterized protein (DUF58 family)
MNLMSRTITLWFGLMLAAVVMSQDAAAHPVHEVQVMASKPGFDPSAIEVTAGEPVRLVIRSKDVVARVFGTETEHRRANPEERRAGRRGIHRAAPGPI